MVHNLLGFGKLQLKSITSRDTTSPQIRLKAPLWKTRGNPMQFRSGQCNSKQFLASASSVPLEQVCSPAPGFRRMFCSLWVSGSSPEVKTATWQGHICLTFERENIPDHLGCLTALLKLPIGSYVPGGEDFFIRNFREKDFLLILGVWKLF